MVVDTEVLVHDIRYFLVAYGLAIARPSCRPSSTSSGTPSRSS